MIIGTENMEKKMKNKEKINYEIRQLSWSKRRSHTEEKKALSVELVGFEKIENHMCKMLVDYEEEKVELNARVMYNEIQDFWLVSGINTHGHQCTIKLLN